MTAKAQAQLTLPVTPRDHIIGPEDAPATLVEYGDYECPRCAAAYPVMEELLQRWGDLVRFVFRHFPVLPIHPRALTAAEAAEAADEQHRFWEMHGMLFQHQNALEGRHLVRYAAHLGMDIPRFTDALAVQRHRDRVQADFVNGMRSGVQDTPALFINGIGYAGSFDVAAISAAIKGNIGVGRYDPVSFTRKAPALSAKQGRK